MNTSRWIPLIAFFALAALLAAGVWMSRRADRDALPSPLIGKPAPEFSLPSLHEPDRLVTLQDLRGAPFVLNVWGSWCAACQLEHPILTRFAERKLVRMVGYNWKDEREDALRWLQRFGNPYWLVLADVEGSTAINWGVYGAPETYLVDANGIVRWKHVGQIDQSIVDGELIPELKKLEGAR